MSRSVAVIDYKMGNLLSVCRALEACGAEPVPTSDSHGLEHFSHMVLPGVGAFKDGMAELAQLGLIEPIRKHVFAGKPFLGICLGMQMMLESSEEFGRTQGLGIVPGEVRLIVQPPETLSRIKVPHIGWSPISPPRGVLWDNSVLKNIKSGDAVYFVHSYAAQPRQRENVLATTTYEGQELVAAIRCGDTAFGCQFHPEKSGRVGLEIIKAFVASTG